LTKNKNAGPYSTKMSIFMVSHLHSLAVFTIIASL